MVNKIKMSDSASALHEVYGRSVINSTKYMKLSSNNFMMQ